jgi:hypothetical protein
MTNTLHRQGTLENLKNDYVIFVHLAKGFNHEGSAPKIREFIRICQKHHPVNTGFVKEGNIFHEDFDLQKVTSTLQDGTIVAAVFNDLDKLEQVIRELIQADLGISINISGLLDEVQACCRKAGIERHSVEHSLGVWGAKERLPEKNILELNTMCGHGMVSFNLIRKMIDYVKLRRLTTKEAARILAKCCECGAFNPTRAELLFEKIRKQGN